MATGGKYPGVILFHRTSNGENPSNRFRDMGSAKSGLHFYHMWQIFNLMGSPLGAYGPMIMILDNCMSRKFPRTSNQSGQCRDIRSAKSKPAGREKRHVCKWWLTQRHTKRCNVENICSLFPHCIGDTLLSVRKMSCILLILVHFFGGAWS